MRSISSAASSLESKSSKGGRMINLYYVPFPFLFFLSFLPSSFVMAKLPVSLGNILMELLCAVLISLDGSSLDSLSKKKLLEWKGVMQDLLEAKFSLSFLMEHLRSLAHALFQRQTSKSLDAEIAAAEEALTRAHKTLQDLKIKRQKVLSSLAVPAISSDGSLLASLIS